MGTHPANNPFVQRNLAQLTAQSSVAPESTGENAANSYDRLAERPLVYPGFFTREYMNFGYWADGTRSRRDASDALMQRLTAHIVDRTGTVLDVACGLGFTTRYLGRHWAPARVHGINITARQLECCRINAPGCVFSLMDAAAMTFGDESFDHIICVEAAFHFRTRNAFLREAWRILRPGGSLALTDLLLHEAGHVLLPTWHHGNYLPSLDSYRETVGTAGFSRVELTDITDEGVHSYLRFMFSQVHDDWLSGACDYRQLQAALAILHRIAATHRFNIMCIAWKS